MSKQAQIGGGVVGAIALAAAAFFLFRPAEGPVPEANERARPDVEQLREAPKPAVRVARPKRPEAPPVPEDERPPADHPFLQIPAMELPDIPDSIKDPMGVLPITAEAMEQSMFEMGDDVRECAKKHLADKPALKRVVSIDFHINAEVPPPEYGAPDDGQYGIIRGAKVMDSKEDLSSFEACVTEVMKAMIYDKPPGDGARVNWTVDLG